VLTALWALIFGIFFWPLGWIFGAQSWLIDMNLFNWTEYTIRSLLSIIPAMLLSALVGAVVGLIAALIYNATAGIMGGIKIELD